MLINENKILRITVNEIFNLLILNPLFVRRMKAKTLHHSYYWEFLKKHFPLDTSYLDNLILGCHLLKLHLINWLDIFRKC